MSHENLSRLRRSADIAYDHEILEEMALKRTELQTALDLIQDNDQSCFISTNKASFLQLDNKETRTILENRLKALENDISKLCTKIQEQLDEQL
jgi:hypothetical protein